MSGSITIVAGWLAQAPANRASSTTGRAVSVASGIVDEYQTRGALGKRWTTLGSDNVISAGTVLGSDPLDKTIGGDEVSQTGGGNCGAGGLAKSMAPDRQRCSALSFTTGRSNQPSPSRLPRLTAGFRFTRWFHCRYSGRGASGSHRVRGKDCVRLS